MASRRNTRKSSTGPNQPHSRAVKDSSTASKKHFEVPSDFISSQFPGRYPPKIPTQPTIDPSYTSSPDIPQQDSSSPDIPHQDSYSNKELQDVSSEEPLYLILKSEVNLKSLRQIPIRYQIPIS